MSLMSESVLTEFVSPRSLGARELSPRLGASLESESDIHILLFKSRGIWRASPEARDIQA